MRYRIEAIQYGADDWAEVCQVENNPEEIAEGVRNKKLRITLTDGRGSSIAKYSQVRIVDTGATKSSI